MSRRTIIFNLIFLLALSVMIILWARFFVLKVGNSEMVNSPQTNKGRVSFLIGYGWEVDETPVSAEEFSIPETFDNRYEAYSKFQLENGFDISRYKGQTAVRYSYRILNHPEEDDIYAGVSVSGDNIVCAEVFTLGDNADLKPISRK